MKFLWDAFSNLSPNDKRALTILVGFTAVMAMLFGGMGMRNMSSSSERQAKQAQSQFAKVLELAQGYATAKAQKPTNSETGFLNAEIDFCTRTRRFSSIDLVFNEDVANRSAS